jgi:hypothetical protein
MKKTAEAGCGVDAGKKRMTTTPFTGKGNEKFAGWESLDSKREILSACRCNQNRKVVIVEGRPAAAARVHRGTTLAVEVWASRQKKDERCLWIGRFKEAFVESTSGAFTSSLLLLADI